MLNKQRASPWSKPPFRKNGGFLSRPSNFEEIHAENLRQPPNAYSVIRWQHDHLAVVHASDQQVHLSHFKNVNDITIDPGNNTYDCSISFRDEQWRQHCTMFPDDIGVLTSTEDVYNENDVLIFHRQDRWHILYQTIIGMYMFYLGMYIVMEEEVRTSHHAYQLH